LGMLLVHVVMKEIFIRVHDAHLAQIRNVQCE